MSKTVERRFKLPRSSFFLFGPRGTGKSTLIRERLASTYLVDLLDESRYQSYLAAPSRFGDELRTRKRGSWIAIDEIQRLPSLLNEVHRAIEKRNLRFALTGSSARKLRRSSLFVTRASFGPSKGNSAPSPLKNAVHCSKGWC